MFRLGPLQSALVLLLVVLTACTPNQPNSSSSSTAHPTTAPTSASTSAPTSTPVAATSTTVKPEPATATPGSLAHYQGPNPYRSTPAFSVDYDPSVWEFIEKDGSGVEPKLIHRSIAKCTVWLGAGPIGAQAVSTAQIAGYEWTVSLIQPAIIDYSTPLDDIAFIIGLFLPEPYDATVKSPCQDALEDVLQTFKVAAN